MVTYKRPTNWMKANNHKNFALDETKKQMQGVWHEGRASTVHVMVALENNKSMVPCVSQIMTKNISRWTKTWHLQTLVFM